MSTFGGSRARLVRHVLAETAVLAVLGLSLLALFNIAAAVAAMRLLRRRAPALLSDEEAPPGLVLLCLRGGDPFLAQSLRSLFAQDYPDYRVRIVLDSASDSARPSQNCGPERTRL